MGRLIDGRWTTEGYRSDEKGRFIRDDAQFRDWVRADRSTRSPAEAGRYHLYVSLACPWASRGILMRRLKKLEAAVTISIVDPFMGEQGWTFSGAPGAIPDTVNGARHLHEIYSKARPDYSGRVTVPVLWDKQTATIVNNESREVLRMLDLEFDAFGDRSVNLCPASLREDIDRTIDDLYAPINNGVYRAGFAETQSAYEEAVTELFAALDAREQRLAKQRYLCGQTLTEADVCLFTTLVRFDVVYHYHFKCNLKKIGDYENLSAYLRDLYQTPGVRETVNFDHIKQHYYRSHDMLNPRRIVPLGPSVELDAPHDRASLG
jgi:putative glutathione S-transferase